ncbi:hypothetical protein MHT86_02605 [Corynebacterium mastitidis]|uniref:hypothetical protein n=1 Tax=Corynebacterium mastitidis TaxID=161890 RepID=UPI0012FF3BB6|nr:hypothetical protein [Corynebacterium mastitidis]MCH6196392.1 hypothetical protein [Corynebacterium mastitidis]
MKSNTLIWSIIFLAAGIAAGWIAGSWTTCNPKSSCEANIQAINTVATSIGSVGTFASIIIGIMEFKKVNMEKFRSTVLDSRRSKIKFIPLPQKGNSFTKIHMEVTNQTARDMEQVYFSLDNEVISEISHQIHTGRTFGTSISVSDVLGEEKLEGTEEMVRKKIKEELRDRVSFHFKINGEKFTRKGNESIHVSSK